MLADFDEWHGNSTEQVIQLLTGVSSERLKGFGGVDVRDPLPKSDILRSLDARETQPISEGRASSSRCPNSSFAGWNVAVPKATFASPHKKR